MDKPTLVRRIGELHNGVNALGTAGKIPIGSEKEIFLILLPHIIKGETLLEVFKE